MFVDVCSSMTQVWWDLSKELLSLSLKNKMLVKNLLCMIITDVPCFGLTNKALPLTSVDDQMDFICATQQSLVWCYRNESVFRTGFQIATFGLNGVWLYKATGHFCQAKLKQSLHSSAPRFPIMERKTFQEAQVGWYCSPENHQRPVWPPLHWKQPQKHKYIRFHWLLAVTFCCREAKNVSANQKPRLSFLLTYWPPNTQTS